MKIYDNASWHIDAGEDEEEVVSKFKVFFEYLKNNNMLTEEGHEVYEFCMDSSVTLHERLVTCEGNEFLSEKYDELINYNSDKIRELLNNQ